MRKKLYTFVLFLLFGATGLLAQPANDACSGATTITPDGTCVSGTTTGSADNWQASVGCQTGGQHNDVWYTYVATENQLTFTVNSLGMGNNAEVIVAESPCGSCACSFSIVGTSCGPMPLTDTVTGLNVGATYFITISSSSGADGDFQFCPDEETATAQPGQDCPTATNICDDGGFSQGTVASGNGLINGGGSQEDMIAYTSCFGTSERQSQWYLFTASSSGTIEFNINPTVASDDYDFVLFDITTSGCALSGATEIACNWSGCPGATGISSDATNEPGVTICGNGPFAAPQAFEQTPPTVTEGNTYALLIDNYTTSNNGFDFTWGGASGGMTATIGPEADFSASTNICDATVTNLAVTNGYTYTWSWGDGTTTTGANPGSHTYGSAGTYTITLEVEDPIGCTETTSLDVTVCILPVADLNLRATPEMGRVRLDWVLPEELQASHFLIERSQDGSEFELVKRVSNTQPTGKAQAFQSLDEQPLAGRSFYRLVAVSPDGQTEYSQTVEVVFNTKWNLLSLFPNPAQDQLNVAWDAEADGQGILRMVDMAGRTVYSQPVSWIAGTNSLRLPLADVAPGIYYVRLQGAGVTAAGRIVKN